MKNSEIKFQKMRSQSIARPDKYSEKYLGKYKKRKLRKYIIRENVFIELGDIRGKKILDIGCGDGEIAVLCAVLGAEVFGCDISPELIDIAKQRAKINHVYNNCHFEISDLERFPFNPGKYDFIISFGVLHHTKFKKYFNLAANSLRGNGKFIIVEPVDLSTNFNNFVTNIRAKKRLTSSLEKPLSREDIEFIFKNLHIEKTNGFNFLARIARLLNGDNLTETGTWAVRFLLKIFHIIDYLVFPIFKRLYRVIFIVGRKK